MRRQVRPWILALGMAALAAAAPRAQPLPDPQRPVRDDYGLLDPVTRSRVATEIEALENATGAEIGILITDSTHGADPHAYALRVFNHWGVGKRDEDNGVLLLFAMDDRRVELVPGIAYEELFDRARTERLLQGVVVPQMRAGQPQRAVAALVEEVAREIRIHEGLEVPPAPGVGEAGPGEEAIATAVALPDRSPRGGRGAWLAAPLVLWLLLILSVLVVSFRTGRLMLAKPILWILVLVPGLAIAVLALWGRAVAWGGDEMTAVGTGALLGSGGLALLARHLCPRCRRWCSIRRKTLRAATYTSSGSGQRTVHCRHCLYHQVSTYRIPRRTRSSSSSSSGSSFSSSSSFGGGSSRGGGGGASW